jgi:hypothetical protein
VQCFAENAPQTRVCAHRLGVPSRPLACHYLSAAPAQFSAVLKAVKVGSTISTKRGTQDWRQAWQARFFDRALRAVKEYNETVEYIYLNPVRRGPARKAEEWQWSSVHEYAVGTRRSRSGDSGWRSTVPGCRRGEHEHLRSF